MTVLRAILLWALAGLPAAAECVMSVRMAEDPPYLTSLEDGRPGGVNADVAREALRRMGCRAEFRMLPFPRSLRDLQDGVLDIVPDLFRTPEREIYALFSRTHDQVPNRLFIRASDRGRWDIKTFQDLSRLGVRLGVQTGVLVGPDFPGAMGEAKFRALVSPARTQESLWRMLLAGHVDAVILDEQNARWELKHFGFDQSIVGTDFLAATAPAYFAFSRASVTAEQVQAFDSAVDQMRGDGTLAAILAAYGLEPGAAIDMPE